MVKSLTQGPFPEGNSFTDNWFSRSWNAWENVIASFITRARSVQLLTSLSKNGILLKNFILLFQDKMSLKLIYFSSVHLWTQLQLLKDYFVVWLLVPRTKQYENCHDTLEIHNSGSSVPTNINFGKLSHLLIWRSLKHPLLPL